MVRFILDLHGSHRIGSRKHRIFNSALDRNADTFRSEVMSQSKSLGNVSHARHLLRPAIRVANLPLNITLGYLDFEKSADTVLSCRQRYPVIAFAD